MYVHFSTFQVVFTNFCYTHILYVKELPLWWDKGLRHTILHYSIMLLHLFIAFTENCINWTYKSRGLNHQYPFTTLSFTSFYNNVLNSVQSVSPFMMAVTIFWSAIHRLVSNYKYTERPIGSSHCVRGCHHISTIMMLVAEIWYDTAQYSPFNQSLTPRLKFKNRGMSDISYGDKHKWKKAENSCHNFIW